MNKFIQNFKVQKLIAEAGICSRKNAEKLILNQKVKVNNKIINLGDRASWQDQIFVNNKQIFKKEKVYYLINKPPQTICSLKDNFNRKIVTNLIDDSRKLFYVGRLDYNTTGTLLITNDGELSNRLCHPKFKILRIYRARIDEPLTNDDLKFLNSDHVFIDKIKSHQKVLQVDQKSYTINLKVGTNHHIKKLFNLVNKKVIHLTRIEFASLSHVKKLKQGQYRKLKNHEIKKLKLMVNIK